MTAKWTQFSLFTLILLAGCGVDKTYTGGKVSMSFSNSLESGGSPLSDNEMAVALRICYAFRSKRTKFMAELLENPFNFTLKENDCSNIEGRNVVLNTTLKQLNVGSPMSYETTGVNFAYQREVYTDVNGELSNLCSQVLKGETPLDIAEIKNEIYEYQFFSQIYDTAEIKIGALKAPTDAEPTVSQVIRLEVLTNQQSSGDYLGMVNRSTRYYPCNGGSNTASREQTFIAP